MRSMLAPGQQEDVDKAANELARTRNQVVDATGCGV